MRVDVKPLSVNKVWQGKRFKTKEYEAYEEEVLFKLRAMDIPPGHLYLTLYFGMSNGASDWDNPIKPFVDILQKKFSFNDNRIKKAYIEVIKTKKGEEYIDFEIKPIA